MFRRPGSVRSLIFGMFTAIATGGAIALLSIFAFDFSKNGNEFVSMVGSVLASQIEQKTASLEEGEVDPTLLSRFSRSSIYSADDGREVIESARNSISRSENITVSSSAYLVVDLDRDVVVLEKNSTKVLPIASITKLVTAVIAKSLLNGDESITMSSQALATYGNEAKLRQGEKFTVDELLYPLLMVSSNDASEVLARYFPRGREGFIKEMNNFVNAIGAYKTYFIDPSGLSQNNVSTAKDILIITKWILKNEPEVFEITGQKEKTIRTHTWTSPTHLLNLDAYVGGKNGYTPEAGRTSVALFNLGKQKRTFGVILLGSSDRDNDILELLDEAVR